MTIHDQILALEEAIQIINNAAAEIPGTGATRSVKSFLGDAQLWLTGELWRLEDASYALELGAERALLHGNDKAGTAMLKDAGLL